MFYKLMIGIKNLCSERWLTKENVVAKFVTFVDLYFCAVGEIIILNI